MIKKYILIVFIPVLGFTQQDAFWKKNVSGRIEPQQLLERASSISKYALYDLDLTDLKKVLRTAVSRSKANNSNTILKFPNSSGKMERYKVYSASVLDEDFSKRYPDIQSYVGVNIDRLGVNMRFSITPFGFHAAIYNFGETFYIDPYTQDLRTYVFYSTRALEKAPREFNCKVHEGFDADIFNYSNANHSPQRTPNDQTLRTFRLALACTQEYANYHIDAAGQQNSSDEVKRATVLAAMVVTMTRVNGIFERDLGITMALIDNSSLIFLEEDDGYGTSGFIGENISIINSNIGLENYDVGHVFTRGGGGAAFLGCICTNFKAGGYTGLSNPVGDFFDVDYVSHEFGHQYGAPHTFNNCSGGGGGPDAVEPGSGSTIMAYASLCAANVQLRSDDYFHSVSIASMWNRIVNGPTCAATTNNGNTPPTVNAGLDYTIPYGTAFTLSGSGSDDTGIISYNWEQIDVGVNRDPISPNNVDGPLFRTKPDLLIGERTLPPLETVLQGELATRWEVIPNVARELNFALTVRDNEIPGQNNRDDMVVTVADTGPFKTTYPNITDQSFLAGSTHTITWDIAGTTGNGINTSAVDILLSTNGGQSFDIVLSSSTPNDGSESVSFPYSLQEPYCRIKIQPVDNIYFAISTSFSIGVELIQNCNTYSSGPINTPIPDGAGVNQPGTPVSVPFLVSTSDPINSISVNIKVTHTYVSDLIIDLAAPDGTSSRLWDRNCGGSDDIDVSFVDGAANISCDSPTQGTYAPVNPLNVFNGLNAEGTWNLVFTDYYNQDIGTIDEFSLDICTTSQVFLDDNCFEFESFNLYPNPSRGTFNLNFCSDPEKEVFMTVFDISGKLILNRKFEPTDFFDEEISLENLSSGVYLMKLENNSKSIIRRLIID